MSAICKHKSWTCMPKSWICVFKSDNFDTHAQMHESDVQIIADQINEMHESDIQIIGLSMMWTLKSMNWISKSMIWASSSWIWIVQIMGWGMWVSTSMVVTPSSWIWTLKSVNWLSKSWIWAWNLHPDIWSGAQFLAWTSNPRIGHPKSRFGYPNPSVGCLNTDLDVQILDFDV